MEMHQVRYFLSVCETRNFTRAAELCHVSQPSLTHAIKKLEEEVGGALFHRERNAVRPTALGVTLQPRLEQIQTEAQAVLADAHHFLRLEQVPLKVGVLLTVGPARISGFLSHFQRRYPGVEVEIYDGRQDDLMPRLRQNDLDVAVINLLDPLDESFTVQTLYRERYVVGFAPGHRLQRLKKVRLADVSGERYVDRLSCEMRDMVMAVCSDRRVELYATHRSEREDWVQGMVMAGLGFAFLPEYSVVAQGIQCRPLVEPEVSRDIAAVAPRLADSSPVVETFLGEAALWHWKGKLPTDSGQPG